MNWSLLLSQYPRSIMNNEFPIILLTFLEMKGITKDEEIYEEFNSDIPMCKKVLNDLYQNRFIEFSHNTIRLNERAKLLLTQFDCHNYIIDNVLNIIQIPDNERNNYKNILIEYRKNSYEQYLNSISTINKCNIFYDLMIEDINTDSKIKNKATSLMTLLLRDIRNWYAHKHIPKDIFKNFDKNIKNMLINNKKIKIYNKRDKKISDEASILLTILDQSMYSDDINKWNEIINKELIINKDIAFMIIIFDFYQQHWEINQWYDEWSTFMSDIKQQKKSINKNYKQIYNNIKNIISNNNLALEWKPHVDGSYNWWQHTLKDDKSFDHNLIIFAPSLEYLSQVTGKNIKETQNMILDIKLHCDRLLKTSK